MTDQEQINVNVQRQIDAQNARIDSVLAKVDMVIGEIQQQREDIRRAQEKHDADMREIRERQEAAQAKHDADKRKIEFYALDAKFDGLIQQIKYTGDKTIIGFGIMALAMGAVVIAALK